MFIGRVWCEKVDDGLMLHKMLLLFYSGYTKIKEIQKAKENNQRVDGLRDTQRAAKKAENNKNKNDT
jgi:hypothetical protein